MTRNRWVTIRFANRFRNDENRSEAVVFEIFRHRSDPRAESKRQEKSTVLRSTKKKLVLSSSQLVITWEASLKYPGGFEAVTVPLETSFLPFLLVVLGLG